MTCKICDKPTIMDGVCSDCSYKALDIGITELLKRKEIKEVLGVKK
jgi:hypothetical protein